MNVAVILAAGADRKFEMSIPKQFVNVNNRPIIVYTLETFQKHPEIDAILIACLSGWEKMVEAYAKQFDITKLRWIVTGGDSVQETSELALRELQKECSKDSVVVVHDAIRPLVTDEIISDSIRVCKEQGMGVAAVTSTDNVVFTEEGITGKNSIARTRIRRIQTPQTFRLGELCGYHEEAEKKGITGALDVSDMVSDLGKEVYLSKGSEFNIKTNSVEDIEMFKALYNMVKRDMV